MTADAIRIEGLRKTYAGGKEALQGVDLTVPEGSIFGLLGPNGAGKSTLINILAGLVIKTAGKVEIQALQRLTRRLRQVVVLSGGLVVFATTQVRRRMRPRAAAEWGR